MYHLPYSLLTTGNSELRVIVLLVIFALIIVAAYFVTFYIAKMQTGRFSNRNLQIIEAISIGNQKSIQIVKAGKNYLVIGVTKTEINLLQTLGEDDITFNEELDRHKGIPFRDILNKYKSKEGRDNGDHHETKD